MEEQLCWNRAVNLQHSMIFDKLLVIDEIYVCLILRNAASILHPKIQ